MTPVTPPPAHAPIAVVDLETTGLHPTLHLPWEGAVILLTPVPDRAADVPAGHVPDNHVEVGGHGYQMNRYLWQFDADLADADPFALKIGGFYDRRWQSAHDADEVIVDESVIGAWPIDERVRSVRMSRCVIPNYAMREWAEWFVKLTAGAFLVGAVPSFDERRLDQLVRAQGQAPRWHYQPVCVETLTSGVLAERRRWLDALAAAGYEVPDLGGIEPMPPWDSDDLTVIAGARVPDEADRHTAMGDCDWALGLLQAAYARAPLPWVPGALRPA